MHFHLGAAKSRRPNGSNAKVAKCAKFLFKTMRAWWTLHEAIRWFLQLVL